MFHKTGTLTLNRLSLSEPWCASGSDRDGLIDAGALATHEGSTDAIDRIVLTAAKGDVAEGLVPVRFIPFDPVSKRTEASWRAVSGQTFKVSKGAPQAILALCAGDPGTGACSRAVDAFAERGIRTLAIARADGDGPWRVLGLLSFSDPPREDSATTIAAARAMGVDVKMITGDRADIARDIAAKVGLGTNILEPSSLESGDAKAVARVIAGADGFGQVFPEHKFRIVEVLQGEGRIVGMTGDGVNDAPALRKADVGIAVSGATDAARAAADIVLLTPGLSVIIEAITESRRIFRRMTNYAVYRIAETIRVLLFMSLAILVFDFYPLTAAMIVLLALLNDGAILSIAYDNAPHSARPDVWRMKSVLGIASMLGVAGVVASFALFWLAERVYGIDRETVRTLIYLKLSVAGHFMIFVTRTRGPFWSHKPARILVLAVAGTQVIATFVAVYGLFMPAIGWRMAAAVWGYALVWFFINDAVKLLAVRLFDSSPAPVTAGVLQE